MIVNISAKAHREALSSVASPALSMFLTRLCELEEYVIPGNIIFRQRGTQWYPGENCDMGRDHTIFAKEAGYVRFYRDPQRHPRRRYIGVALERGWKLPTPPNAARRRRLGMLAVERKDFDLQALSEQKDTEIETTVPVNPEPPMTKAQRRLALEKKAKGLIPVKDLVMRRGYQWRMSNAEIGRTAERAGVRIPRFKHGNRFLAWRMRTRRRERAALRRSVEASTKRGKLKAQQKGKKKRKGVMKGGNKGVPRFGR